MPNRICLLTLAAALFAAGCYQDDPTSPGDTAGEIATLPLPNGGSVTFHDLGDGHVGVGERVPATAEPVAATLVDQYQATPLEVYLALRPDSGDVPDLLLQDHRRAALARGSSPTPRLLAVPSAGASSLRDPGFGDYLCDGSGIPWFKDWDAAFIGVTKYRQAAYRHNATQVNFFYPGAPVYYGTNTNSKTYLGVCNGDYEDELIFEVHRWIDERWKRVATASVAGGTKYTFYSGIPARYRGKAYPQDGATVEHYGYGAAWTLSKGSMTQ